jgi:hypothetical protein
MGSLSNWAELEILDHLAGSSFTVASDLWMALFTVMPTDSSGSGTEVSGTGYVRVEFSNSSTTWCTAAAGSITNKAEIQFATAGAAGWGTVVGWAMFTSSNSGNMYYWGSLTTTKTVNSGDTAKFATGDIDITLT